MVFLGHKVLMEQQETLEARVLLVQMDLAFQVNWELLVALVQWDLLGILVRLDP